MAAEPLEGAGLLPAEQRRQRTLTDAGGEGVVGVADNLGTVGMSAAD